MSVSPFPHHGPLDPEQVHGRDDLVADITERVTNRRPTVVVAPRRYGKTSLLGKVATDLADTVTVIGVDLYELRSWADFVGRIETGLNAVGGPRRARLDQIAASFDINLGVVKSSLTKPGRPAPDATAEQLLDVLVGHAARNPTVAVFDEFSSITRVDGAAGMLRTKLQHHFQRIGLLFAGSEPSTMRMLFEGADQPFYAQADLVAVPPLTVAAFAEIISAGFDADPPAGLAGKIHSFTGGHPQRSMQLADAAWQATAGGSDEAWPDALATVRASTVGGHETRFSGATSADQTVLRLLAADEGLFSRAAGLLDLSRSSAQSSRARLVDAGQIAERNSRLAIVDPLYGDWIATRFPP